MLKLTCTANDMRPAGRGGGLDPPVHKWKRGRARRTVAELDAAFFLLYGIDRNDVEYILSPLAA